MADKSTRVLSFDSSLNRVKLAKLNIRLNTKNNITILKKKVNNLNSIFKQYKIKKCSLLKIDCEGSEYQIFNNSHYKTLKKIKRIVMEVHLFNYEMKEQYNNLKTLLIKNKFTVLEKPSPVHSYLKFLYAYK